MNDESRYLLVQNVPALGVTKDLLDQLALYGNIEECVLPHCVLYDDVCYFYQCLWLYNALDTNTWMSTHVKSTLTSTGSNMWTLMMLGE